jgi:hypothetical protein
MLVKRFGKALVIASLVLLMPVSFVSVGVAQEASPVYGLTRFAQYQGRYAVSFPITNFGQPRINTRANEMSADADIDGAGYFVICMDLHDIGPVDKFFDDLEAYAARANHAHIVRQDPITLGSFPGREVELGNEKGWQRIARDYLVGTRFYSVAVQARDRKLNREMARQFLDSFQLLDGKMPPVVPMPSAVPMPSPMPSADARPQIPVSRSSDEQPRPLSVREQIIRMSHGTAFEDLAPTAPAIPAPAPQPTNPISIDHRYVNRAGRYFIDFPQTPSESIRPDPNGPVLHQADLDLHGIAYGVMYRDLQASELSWARAQPEGLAIFHTVWREGVVRKLNAAVTYDGTVQVAGRTGYAVEFVIPDGTHLVGRMVVVGERCYYLGVCGNGVTRDNPLVRQYLDSFGVIE